MGYIIYFPFAQRIHCKPNKITIIYNTRNAVEFLPSSNTYILRLYFLADLITSPPPPPSKLATLYTFK